MFRCVSVPSVYQKSPGKRENLAFPAAPAMFTASTGPVRMRIGYLRRILRTGGRSDETTLGVVNEPGQACGDAVVA